MPTSGRRFEESSEKRLVPNDQSQRSVCHRESKGERTHTFTLAVVVPTAGLVKAGFAAIPFVRTLLVEFASGLLAPAEIEVEGVLECVPLAPTAGLVAVEAGPFLPAADEEEEADVGLTPPIGGLEIPEGAAPGPVVRALPAVDEAAVGRATRPTVVLPAIRPAAFVVLVALDGAVRPAAIEGLGRPTAPDDDEVVEAVLAAAAAASLPAAAVVVPDVDRAEAVVA